MSQSSTVTRQPGLLTARFGTRALAGVAGGLAGGLVFGLMMAMMGMLPMLASMVGSSSAWVGFALHLMISVAIGLGLTLPFGNWLTGYGRGALVGLAYGAIWWVLGPLLLMPLMPLMPLMLGMPLFMLDMTALLSLMGHLIYGAILGAPAVRVLTGRHE